MKSFLKSNADNLQITASLLAILACMGGLRTLDPVAGAGASFVILMLGSAAPYIILTNAKQWLIPDEGESACIWLLNAFLVGAGVIWAIMMLAQEARP